MVFETLASGFGLVEGPTVDAEGGIVFSDVIGGGVHRLAPDGRVELVVPKRRGVGGIALHADGGLVLSGRDLVHVRAGETRRIFSIPELPGWNDLCTDAAGRIYAGALRFAVFDDAAKPVPGECWRIDAAGHGTRLYGDVVHPNGIALSPDERTLYVANSDPERAVWMAYELRPDGSLGPGRVFFDATRWVADRPGLPDGMAVDRDGNLFAAGPGGVLVFSPAGKHLGTLDTTRATANCTFGGDGSTLFITADDSLLRVRLTTKGLGFDR